MKYKMAGDLRMREESFGGVIQTTKGLFLLNKRQYRSLRSYSFSKPIKKTSVTFKKLLEIEAISVAEE
jgi:hypothetical protein